MFISGFTAAVIAYLDSYYLSDTLSRKVQGSTELQGKLVLLKFAGLKDMKKYIQVVYIQKRSQNDTYFQIQYVHITISDENKPQFFKTFQRSRTSTRQHRHRVKGSKSQEFKGDVLNNADKIIPESCCQETSKHKSVSSLKSLITTVIELCWSII